MKHAYSASAKKVSDLQEVSCHFGHAAIYREFRNASLSLDEAVIDLLKGARRHGQAPIALLVELKKSCSNTANDPEYSEHVELVRNYLENFIGEFLAASCHVSGENLVIYMLISPTSKREGTRDDFISVDKYLRKFSPPMRAFEECLEAGLDHTRGVVTSSPIKSEDLLKQVLRLQAQNDFAREEIMWVNRYLEDLKRTYRF